jgi:hypothetical protein
MNNLKVNYVVSYYSEREYLCSVIYCKCIHRCIYPPPTTINHILRTTAQSINHTSHNAAHHPWALHLLSTTTSPMNHHIFHAPQQLPYTPDNSTPPHPPRITTYSIDTTSLTHHHIYAPHHLTCNTTSMQHNILRDTSTTCTPYSTF